MNSLVGLGAVTSFAAGTVSWLSPDGVFDVSFLEEPVMLLAFVLLGRALESRARLQASGDDDSLPCRHQVSGVGCEPEWLVSVPS